MARYIPQTCSTSKTYATEEGAVKRAEAIVANLHEMFKNQTYIIMQADNGRYVPVFVGQRALEAGLQFHAHILG